MSTGDRVPPTLVAVRLDDLEAALDGANSNPYLFDGDGGTEWLTRLQAVVEQANAGSPNPTEKVT